MFIAGAGPLVVVGGEFAGKKPGCKRSRDEDREVSDGIVK